MISRSDRKGAEIAAPPLRSERCEKQKVEQRIER